jgi:hypothetical protein
MCMLQFANLLLITCNPNIFKQIPLESAKANEKRFIFAPGDRKTANKICDLLKPRV